MEIWKTIPSYENIYSASNLGNIINCRTNKILNPSLSNDGYYKVKLYLNGSKKTFKTSKLVAMAFLGHVPCGFKEVVDHIDNDKSNNNLTNLQLITNRENLTKDKQRGSSNYIGVCWDKRKGKWLSSIKINGVQKFLGYFNNELDAANKYQEVLSSL